MCGDDRSMAGSAKRDLRTTQQPSAFLYRAVDGGSLPAVTSTHRVDECPNLRVILDALACLHPAADIHGIRPNPINCLSDVIRGQAARQNDRFAQTLRYQ